MNRPRTIHIDQALLKTYNSSCRNDTAALQNPRSSFSYRIILSQNSGEVFSAVRLDSWLNRILNRNNPNRFAGPCQLNIYGRKFFTLQDFFQFLFLNCQHMFFNFRLFSKLNIMDFDNFQIKAFLFHLFHLLYLFFPINFDLGNDIYL